MFAKPLNCFVFLLISSSLCVESVKTGGSNMQLFEHPPANIASRNNLAKASSCFPGFSVDQGETVKKLGEKQDECENSEAVARSNLEEDLYNFSYRMAQLADGFCVRIDQECRDGFAKNGNITQALDCYIELTLEGRSIIYDIVDQSSMKILTSENEARSIVVTSKNCTTNANIEYLKRSDSLFEQFVKCDKSPSDDKTTTISTSRSPIVTSPSTVAEPTTTTMRTPELPSTETTRSNRFPWN
ncbi:uncharacterized protein LOC129905700 [Episyrphus balteatus]|uniref:uncharacterized protein LOC129905700 n=1 Tax=Episyrphus balteatus TaxID=286459 RepID=UPI002485E58D|nr:uncharacterized protein LOC129905700 [Episyrphus balteatus]